MKLASHKPKVQARIARHKRVRYHNDAYLFPDDSASAQTKLCKQCFRPFANRKKWSSRGQWALVEYCSRACRLVRKKGATYGSCLDNSA